MVKPDDFQIFLLPVSVNYLIANIISIVLAAIFVYVLSDVRGGILIRVHLRLSASKMFFLETMIS